MIGSTTWIPPLMSTTAPTSPILRPEDADFIRSGVSLCVASRDVRHVPSLARALGCAVCDGGRTLRLLLVKSQCEALLRDLEKSGQIAVVFTRPSTHRSLQIKGSDARLETATPGDEQLAQACFEAFADDLLTIGFSRAFTGLYYQHEPSDLVAVIFTPDDVFMQTPGPNAGARLEPLP